jgi:sulfopropanediol 3-dehydrogenase
VATFLKQARPAAPADVGRVAETVSAILEAVRADGWDAVRRYSRELDSWDPPAFGVGQEDVERAKAQLSPELLESMHFAHAQIERFARLQRESMHDFEQETLPGVFLGQRHLPVANVGAYVPSGKYPMLMSAQMSILTAKVAGAKRVVACAAPYESRGIYPAVLWSMHLAGTDEIYCVGGVQALGMMAYGCDGLAPVDFLCGPGNTYVAEAKRQLFGQVGIDLLAGPTERLIIADESADPVVVAADLLGQAEHGPTSPAVLVSLSRPLAQAVLAEVDRQLPLLGSAEVAGTAWRDRGEVLVAHDRAEAVALADEYAPEHLEVQTADDSYFFDHLSNHGTLCLGEEATIVFSDKAIGTNHTLPTGRAARYTGGLWVGKFLKTVTYQRCTREGALLVAPHAGRVSDAELFPGHARSAYIRAEKYGG